MNNIVARSKDYHKRKGKTLHHRILKGCFVLALAFSASAGSPRGNINWCEVLAKDASWDRDIEQSRLDAEKAAQVWKILQKKVQQIQQEEERERAEKREMRWMQGLAIFLLLFVPIGAYVVIRARKRHKLNCG